MFLQLLQKNADYYPHDTAINFGDVSLTHLELLTSVERRARGFLSLGLAAGDRVALLLENGPEYIATFFAIAACRAVIVPLSPELKHDEILFFLNNARARVVVVDAHRVGRARNAASKVSWHIDVVVNGSAPEDCIASTELFATESDTQLPNSSLDDDIVYLYSSGTTGRPKCAPRTVVQYWWEMEQVIESLELGRDDVIFCAIPLFHNFGLVQCMLVAVGTAARLVILKSSGPFQLYRNEALKLLDKERVTIFAGVPFMFDSFIESSTSVDLSSIRICYSAAATLSEKTSKTFRDKFGIPLRDHYGCTEVGAMTIELDSNPEQHRQSVGRALKGVHIKIIGSDGQELPPGDAGEIVVRCRAMTRGYLGMGEVDNTAFSDGHFCTGDLGRLDEDGRLYLLGRKKNIIDVVGQKVSPVEVEDVLLKHPAVRDSIVIGVPNPNGNAQIVAAYVVCDGDCTVEDLFSFCHERLANFKVPQIIEFISSVPKNNLGKAPRDRATIESYRVQPGDLEARRNSR